MIVLKRPTAEHMAYFYDNLRAVDRTESALLHGRALTMDEMMVCAGRRTIVLVALVDGVPAALFGAGGSVAGHEGRIVWFLGTEAIVY